MNHQAKAPSLSFECLAALNAVTSRLETALEPLGLSLAKFGALSRLVAANEPLPLSTLAERCSCVRSNITQLVDRLEAEKLVARVHDPRDRRSILAELTEEGRRRQAAGKRAIEKAERDIFSHVGPERQDTLRELFQALHAGS
jgi:DNA-binding MarR family transcriptional regulator